MSRLMSFRVSGLPIWTTLNDLNQAHLHFPGETTAFRFMKSTLCFSCYNDGTKTAITQFSPHNPRVLAELANGASLVVQLGAVDIGIDKDFYGLTSLYAAEGPIKADIVALSGLDGHAYGSWRTKSNPRRMWLQDFLPQDVPQCRTMIYGYNSKLQCRSTHTVLDFTRGFLEELAKARSSEEEMKRPIVFIGHSFGGIVVVQSIVKAKECGSSGFLASLFSATHATIFFGTPHRGLIIDDILAMLKENSPREALVESIRKSSDSLVPELEKFIGYSTSFKVVSFYETKQTRKLNRGADGKWTRTGDYFTTVEANDALVQLTGHAEETLPSEGDHSDMVKLPHRGDAAYSSVVRQLQKFRSDKDETTAFANQPAAVIQKRQQVLRRKLESGLVDVRPRIEHGWKVWREEYLLLLDAAREGDEVTLTMILRHQADVNYIDENTGMSALQLAARFGHVGAVGILLMYNAFDTNNALQHAIEGGHIEVVKLLLKTPVNINGDDPSLLWRAVKFRQPAIVELLLENGARATTQASAFHLAAQLGDETSLKLMVKYGVEVNVGDINGHTAAYYARKGKHQDALKYLQGLGGNDEGCVIC